MKLALATVMLLVIGPVQEPPRTRISPPPMARIAWAYVLSCTHNIGLLPSKGSNLADVKWFKTKMDHSLTSYMVGEYIWPDTIVLDELVLDQKDIIAHELLHHLMHVDPRDGNPSEDHPYVPFYTPCHLMASQTIDFDLTTGIMTFRGTGLRLAPRTHNPLNPLNKWPI